jgi:STE24 endopeptidase
MVEKKNLKVPSELENVIEQSTFEKARLYALDKGVYSFIHGTYSQIEAYVKRILS